MARYLVKTRARVFQVQSTVQLARLVQIGLVSRDARVRELPDGAWAKAEDHPDIGRLFREQDSERTVVASFVTRPSRAGEASADPEPARPETTKVLWVKTDANTVEVRGTQVLQRLLELGIVRQNHGVSDTQGGPFTPLDAHPRYARLSGAESGEGADDDGGARVGGAGPESAEGVARIPAPDAGDPGPMLGRVAVPLEVDGNDEAEPTIDVGRDAAPRREVSVVIKLSEEEIEYFQEEGQNRETSNVILLSQTDLELLQDGEAGDEDEVILLSADDLEIIEAKQSSGSEPRERAPWEKFRLVMNKASQQIVHDGQPPEPTWDIFRSMMDDPKEDAAVSGPSESSWRRFQARLRLKGDAAVVSSETTWDNFRRIMAGPTFERENPWQSFVRSIHKRRAQLREKRKQLQASGKGRPIAGEAEIKSGVNHVVQESGPNIRIEGLIKDV